MKRTLSFNADWRFHRGDIPVEQSAEKTPMYLEAKTERFTKPGGRSARPMIM